MNRQQRRAVQRGDVRPRVKLYRVPLTPPEMDLVVEGLDALRVLMDQDLEGIERTELQEWAYDRAGRIRDILQAELEGRPYHDTVPERLPPGQDKDKSKDPDPRTRPDYEPSRGKPTTPVLP